MLIKVSCVPYFMVLVKIDEHGRLVIPSEIRKKLGLERTIVDIEVIGNEILIKKVDKGINKEEIEKWLEDLKRISPKIKGKVREIEDKWMSEEYAWRKIGWVG